MGTLVMKAARELGIDSQVSVKEGQFLDPLVTVHHGTKAIQGRISVNLFTEENLGQVKMILVEMKKMAERN
jgi:hypothetical protein